MTLGIFSDSHYATDRLEETLAFFKDQGVRMLLHAGDIGPIRHLEMIRAAEIPFSAVFGNNDAALRIFAEDYPVWNEPLYLGAGEIRVKMMHHPLYMTPDCDLLIYGHTHEPRASLHGTMLVLNPGEVCGRESGRTQCALLKKEGDRWEVALCHREDAGEWVIRKEEFVIG